ncbi:PREDICTED: inhibitor of nuclear factor kappa-B kinase-interacting protein isoform X2 [Crocodylus porosus]|uniref:IKBKB interacting protein n=1 Tax=Crocodylus porosus TaxID=8502 RepID=A0A7M4FND5_CROPO|nr:PREDICTED: inhibitor of nuclear factor kappa-B kinase-interacting protein isoform X2 [Crocodylus porosus]
MRAPPPPTWCAPVANRPGQPLGAARPQPQIPLYFLHLRIHPKMSELKQRKKVSLPPKLSKDLHKAEKQSSHGEPSGPWNNNSQSSFSRNLRTALSLLSLVVCVVLSWFLFQQSSQFSVMEKKYHLLQLEVAKFLDVENEVSLLSQKCEKAKNLMEQLEDLQVLSRVKYLQEDIYSIKTLSNRIIKEKEDLQKNLTTLFQAVTRVEQNTASTAKDITLKIGTVKTDVRRVSGLVSDMTSLADSLQTLEDKVDKVEKTTIKNIGDLLTSSIDRTAKLQSLASDNSRRIEQIKTTLSDLRGDFNRHSDRLLTLESDRVRVLKTVTFANDLKPKVYNLKKDFARLEPMINDLTLRIGRLVEDLLQREKEIAFLNDKLSNLTRVQNEIKDMKDEITKMSDIN